MLAQLGPLTIYSVFCFGVMVLAAPAYFVLSRRNQLSGWELWLPPISFTLHFVASHLVTKSLANIVELIFVLPIIILVGTYLRLAFRSNSKQVAISIFVSSIVLVSAVSFLMPTLPE